MKRIALSPGEITNTPSFSTVYHLDNSTRSLFAYLKEASPQGRILLLVTIVVLPNVL